MSSLFKILVIVFFLCSVPANGQPVSDQLINDVAYRFMHDNFPGGARKIKSSIPYDSTGMMKVYQLDPEGWILMSADRKTQPVIGFSLSGQFVIPEKNISNPEYNFLNNYHKQIRVIVNDRTLREQKAWDTGNELSKGTSGTVIRVNPFMKTNWGQGSGWNRFCPADPAGPGGHVYVGCVAVSMAQAMSIYKIPAKGTGYHNYLDPKYGTQYVNFSNASYVWDSMSVSSSDKYNALLLYHSAVSVSMKFGADGSGTQTLNAASAMRNYFSFSRNIIHKTRTGTVEEWHNLINGELLKGRPVIYAGDADDGKPGHAFNIDGVMSNTYFHINWGWTGSNNGYFTLDALNPGVNNNFNKNQSAIIGIQPLYFPTDITMTDTVVREDRPAGTIVGRVKITDEATDNIYTIKLISDSVFNGSGWTRNFYLDGDTVKTGRIFTAADSRKDTVTVTVNDKFKNQLTRKIALNIGSVVISTGPEYRVREGDYFIYPNPVTDILYFDDNMPEGLIEVNIYSLNGSKLNQLKVTDPGSGIPVNHFRTGVYIIEAIYSDHSVIRQKFIKE